MSSTKDKTVFYFPFFFFFFQKGRVYDCAQLKDTFKKTECYFADRICFFAEPWPKHIYQVLFFS